MAIPYAHTLKDQPKEFWEPVPKHLADVAALAGDYASAFDARAWGDLVGHWHDLGKYSDAFQAYINNGDPDAGEEETSAKGRVDHSTFGARHAVATIPTLAGQLLAFCIAGHHAGLTDATPLDDRSALSFRLDPAKRDIPPVSLPPGVTTAPLLTLPWRLPPTMTAVASGFAYAFFCRMIFSCLVDADWTATEAFDKPHQAVQRRRPRPSLNQLQVALDAYYDELRKKSEPTQVNIVRAAVLADCLMSADLPPGFFSLNVPTGGGKTLASLAFALRHAARHPTLRRVVVAIPFTSIIEQTADQYRRVLGPLADSGLVEHHSNLNQKVDTLRNKQATENWDAPLIVTTNVQLYETLFASKTRPARKLHRLACSVIILDEAQTMPVDLLAPTLAALEELVARYGCTVVLCTATQPALEWREKDFEIGIRDVRPIIRDTDGLHAELRRVTVERIGRIEDDALVARLAAERQVLCVVNTKAHAAKLYDRLSAAVDERKNCFHLSTFMCPQHRRVILRRVRRILKRNALAAAKNLPSRPCRVISTQLIEAGVDVDFPCVYRAAAGFDSIAQAAGRCNREGKLRDADGRPALGRVYVFDAEIPPPKGLLRSAADVASQIADDYPDPIRPDAIEKYFSLLYWQEKRSHAWDSRGVLPCFEFDPRHIAAHRKLAPFKFRSAAEAYQLIRDEQTPVLVPYNKEANDLIKKLESGGPLDYDFYKSVQQYSVGVRDHLLQQLGDNASLYSPNPTAGLWAVSKNNYSDDKGLSAEVVGLDAEMLMS